MKVIQAQSSVKMLIFTIQVGYQKPASQLQKTQNHTLKMLYFHQITVTKMLASPLFSSQYKF